MSIDWEELLGAEGDELQDAYDRAVEDWDRQMEPAPAQKPGRARRRGRKRRRGGYYDNLFYYEGMDGEGPKRKGPSTKKEPAPYRILPDCVWRKCSEPTPFLEAVRLKLEAAYQLEFHWIRSSQGTLMGLADSEDRLVKIDNRLGGIAVTYPFSPDAKKGDGRQLLDARYQDREPRWEYDAARLPLRLIAADGETLWDRASNHGGLAWLWVEIPSPDGTAELRPVFLYQDGSLIWEDAPLYARFAQKEREKLASIRQRMRGRRWPE